MSRLEEKAKPFLLPLLTGGTLRIDKYGQELVANWIALKLRICEFSEPDDVVASQSVRTEFMGRRWPPPIMGIWIGRVTDPAWSNTYFRYAACLGWGSTSGPFLPPGGSYSKNTQAQILVIGELFVYCTMTTVPGIEFDTPPSISAHMRKLWPFRSPMTAPLWPGLKDAHIRFIASDFDRFTRGLKFSPRPSRK